MAPRPTTRTITVIARSRTRFARLRLRYPAGTSRSRLPRLTTRYPDVTDQPEYDPGLAFELIAGTGELPARKHDLIVIMTQYRYALHALATQAASRQNPSAR